MLAVATKVVNDYGSVLKSLDASLYGQPQSSLPHAKSQIREAILALFEEVGSLRPDIREGLIHGFVYLAQFIPDDEAAVVAAGQHYLTEHDSELPEETTMPAVAMEALRIINRIKADMERAAEEIGRIDLRRAS